MSQTPIDFNNKNLTQEKIRGILHQVKEINLTGYEGPVLPTNLEILISKKLNQHLYSISNLYISLNFYLKKEYFGQSIF